MTRKARSEGSLVTRLARRVAEFGTALGFAPGSRWWWLVLLLAILLPILCVVLFARDEPLVSPFVYRT